MAAKFRLGENERRRGYKKELVVIVEEDKRARNVVGTLLALIGLDGEQSDSYAEFSRLRRLL